MSEAHIVLAAGASYALEALVEQICDPGDAVLIASPYWAGFDISLGLHASVRLIAVHVPICELFETESIVRERFAELCHSSKGRPCL